MLKQSKLEDRGSALLVVIVIGAIIAILAPLLSNYFAGNSKNISANRDAIMKAMNFDQAGNFLVSPATLYMSYQKASYSGTVINPCFKACVEGNGLAPIPDNVCANGQTDDGTFISSYGSLNPKYCLSRDPSGVAPIWHKITLYLPNNSAGDPIAGPDFHPSSGPANDPNNRIPIRYTREGDKCMGTDTGISYQTHPKCPVRVEAFFHPICSGDPWDNDLAKLNPPPGTTYAGTFENTFSSISQIEDTVRSHLKNNLNRYLQDIGIAEALAAPSPIPGRGCPECKNLEDAHGVCQPVPAGYTMCANSICRAYDTSYPQSWQVCCYSDPTFKCNQNNGSTSTGTFTSSNTWTGARYDNTNPASDSYRACARATRISVYVKSYISVGTGTETSTDFRAKAIANKWSAAKILDSRFEANGSPRPIYEFPNVKLCGGTQGAITNQTCP